VAGEDGICKLSAPSVTCRHGTRVVSPTVPKLYQLTLRPVESAVIADVHPNQPALAPRHLPEVCIGPQSGAMGTVGKNGLMPLPGMGRLKDRQTAGPQHPHELGKVGLAQAVGHVLKDEDGQDQVKAGIVKLRQVCPIVDKIITGGGKAVEQACLGDHGVCQVNPHNAVDMLGQRLSESAHTAAEVKRPAPRRAKPKRRGRLHESGHFGNPDRHKFIEVPLPKSSSRPRADSPQRILLTKGLPIPSQLLNRHGSGVCQHPRWAGAGMARIY
jgi:hypothetical protein